MEEKLLDNKTEPMPYLHLLPYVTSFMTQTNGQPHLIFPPASQSSKLQKHQNNGDFLSQFKYCMGHQTLVYPYIKHNFCSQQASSNIKYSSYTCIHVHQLSRYVNLYQLNKSYLLFLFFLKKQGTSLKNSPLDSPLASKTNRPHNSIAVCI